MDRVEAHNKFKYGIVWKTCQKVLVGVHLLRWIVTYPVDKVIRSLNNWGQGDTGRRRGRVIRGAVMSNIDKLIRFEKKKKKTASRSVRKDNCRSVCGRKIASH